MQLTDTHAHIYLPEFTDDLHVIIEKAPFVSKIYMPNIDLHTIAPMCNVHVVYPEKCFPCIGLHPCSVKENYEYVLAEMEKQIVNNKITFHGIGETGLDYYWDLSFKKEQIKAFEIQLEWAKSKQLPVIIHSRNSLDDCIAIVAKHQDGNLKGVFHCFSGNAFQLERALATGLFIGIGGVVTFKNGGLNKILLPSHIAKIVLETDAPYLAPVPHRGKRNEPAYLQYVLARLSDLLMLTENEIAAITTDNAAQLFELVK